MLLDEAQITVSGGHGGAGAASFFPGKKAGPSGGNGGRGGDVLVVASSDLTALNQFSKIKLFEGQKGDRGSPFCKDGKDGDNLVLKLPVGTEIIDVGNGDRWELTAVDQTITLVTGGKGGRGNYELRSARNTTPLTAQIGLDGQTRKLSLNLKFIADYGLIGLPNAGKSSLLNELTAADVKVADYPFTTLEANLGVYNGKILADIPGLIEGASTGKGLGIKFLKHIERVTALLHCIGADTTDPVKDYQTVRAELGNYNLTLLDKQEYILITKSDLVDSKVIKKITQALKKYSKTILPVSIHDWDSIQKLKDLIV